MTRERRILLVEDDEDLVACLRAVLEEEDAYEVLSASDGAAALQACDRAPSLALVDLHIPGGPSGPELVAALRRRLPPDARLILLSAERDLAARARELGADGCLEKPFDIDELLRVVREHTGALIEEPAHP